MPTSTIDIHIAWFCQGVGREERLAIAPGSTISDVLATEAVRQLLPTALVDESTGVSVGVGVWGRVRPRSYVLREADRLEVYSALLADPKEQRRRRAP